MSDSPPPPDPQIVAVIKLKCTPANREEWDNLLRKFRELAIEYKGKIVLAEPVIYQELHSQI